MCVSFFGFFADSLSNPDAAEIIHIYKLFALFLRADVSAEHATLLQYKNNKLHILIWRSKVEGVQQHTLKKV